MKAICSINSQNEFKLIEFILHYEVSSSLSLVDTWLVHDLECVYRWS